jgi:hypothetical protein
MAEILRDTALTPDKKGVLLDLLKTELSFLRDSARSSQLDMIAKQNILILKNELNSLVDKIIEKKGIITPTETNEVLDKVDEAKKRRLENDYSTSQSYGGFIQLVLIVIGAIFVVKLMKKYE